MPADKEMEAFWLPPNLEPMRPYYTCAAVDAARARVAFGEKLPLSLSKHERKLAILLVRAINPDEILKGYEEAIARGVCDEKLQEHKARGELPRVLGGHSQTQAH